MIRPARKEDCSALYDLLMEIFQDMELPVLSLIPPQDLQQLFVESMEELDSRYSYQNCLVYEHHQEIVGCCFGYKGELEHELNQPIQKKLAEYGLDSAILFYPDEETFAGEWYLDSLVTKQGYRGNGIAKKLIRSLPKVAVQEQEKIIGLNCEKDNLRARSLYEKMGFRKTSEILLSGHKYDHMQLRVVQKAFSPEPLERISAGWSQTI